MVQLNGSNLMKIKKLKKTIFLFLISLNCFADAEGLRQYLGGIINRHPNLAEQNLNKSSQEDILKSKKEKLWPEINLRAASVKGYSTLNKDAEYSEVTLSLQQPLYAPSQGADIDVEEQEILYQKFLTATTIDDIAYTTIELMLDVYQKNDHTNILEESMKTTSKNLSATKKRKQLGELTQSEIDLSDAQYLSQKTLLNIRQNEKFQSRQNLEQFTGAQENISNYKDIIFSLLKEAKNIKNLEKSAKINQAKLNVNKNIKMYDATKSKHLPSLSLIARHGYNDRYRNSIGVEEETVLGLSLNIPIYNGGSISTASTAQYKKVLASRVKLKQTKNNVQNEQKVLLAQIDSLNQSIFLTKQTIKSLTKALKGIKKKQRTGDSSKLEVYNQEAKIIEFKHRRINLLYQLKQVQLRLLYLGGGLYARLTNAKK